MEADDRIESLEEEFNAVKDELKEVLLDIRSYIMDAYNPLRGIASQQHRRNGSGQGGPHG